MKRPTIPEDVRQFVLTSVPSVPFLEALLLMRRHASEHWGAADLAQALYMSETAAVTLLGQLREAELVKLENFASGEAERARYAPPPVLADLIDRLADGYATNLIGISTLIHAS